MQRSPDGKWLPGVSGNPLGRKQRAVEAEYLAVTIASVSKEDWRAIVGMMVTYAKAGNVGAANWLAGYILGKPIERLALSRDADDALGELTDAQIDDILADRAAQAIEDKGNNGSNPALPPTTGGA